MKIKLEKNQIVFHRNRGEFGIYLCRSDEECSCVKFENGEETVSTNWLTPVDQLGVLKCIRRYGELKEAGILGLDD